MPGGWVEVGEAASATIVREMKEELGEDVECGPLLHIAENFFDLAGRRNHEIGFYFRVSHLEFRWFPLAGLACVDLRPTFLCDSLVADPPVFSHAVQREYL